MTPIYQPVSLIDSVIALVFYLIMAAFVFYSMLALYALIRFGKNKLLAFAVSLLYIVISAGLYSAAANNLNLLKF